MWIRHICIADSDDDYEDKKHYLTSIREHQAKPDNWSYAEINGNYIITSPQNKGNLMSELRNYSEKLPRDNFNIEDCKKRLRYELKSYLNEIRIIYPEFDNWISDNSKLCVILIHAGKTINLKSYTKALMDSWYLDRSQPVKLIFSMISKKSSTDPFPRMYWDSKKHFIFPDPKNAGELPSEITTIMNELGIPIPSISQESDSSAAAGPSGVNDYPLTEDEPGEEQKTKPSVEIKGKKDELGIPFPSISQESELPAAAGSSGVNDHAPKEGTTGEDQIMKTPTPTNSFSFWTAVISIVFVGFFAFLSYVFPAIIRFVPDEGEYVTETEVITMPVALPEKKGNIFSIWVPVTINEKNDMKTKKRIVGLTRAKPETFKVIMDAKDNSPADPYHYRRITRKAAPIQYFHLSMIFFV